MHRISYFVNVEWVTLRFHFLFTAGDPSLQNDWSTKWVFKSLKWLKKSKNKKKIMSLPRIEQSLIILCLCESFHIQQLNGFVFSDPTSTEQMKKKKSIK